MRGVCCSVDEVWRALLRRVIRVSSAVDYQIPDDNDGVDDGGDDAER